MSALADISIVFWSKSRQRYNIFSIFATKLINLFMIKIFYAILAFVLAIACNKGDEVIPPVDDPSSGQTPSGAVTSISARFDNSTRASVIVQASGDYQSYWSQNDALLVTDMEKMATFTISSGEGSVSATFSGSLQSTKTPLYAVYPAAGVSLNKNNFSCNIPAAQTFTPKRGTDLKDKVVMFGKSTDGQNFTMSNVASILRFDITLPSDEVIKSLTMTTDNLNIAGKCRFNVSQQSLTLADSKSLTLTYINQPKGKSTDGWATIVPVDFKSSTGRILYDIQTQSGQYIFCHKPNEKYEAGGSYVIKLSVEDFVQVADKELLDEGKYYSDKGISEPDPEPEPGSIAKGCVVYSDGSPAAGVSVSDGFSVVQTATDGTYSLTPHQDAWYIFYSLPSDCQVMITNDGSPYFFTKYNKSQFVYNFTIVKQPNGKDERFSLLCLADPQCSNSSNRTRFINETVPFLNSFSKNNGSPCYGVTLGDIVSSGNSSDTTPQMPYMRSHMSKDKVGFPIFQTMGNHDYLYFNPSSPIEADETSSTYNIKAQRLFEEIFGPINYSWNRADAHIISMRDMLWNDNVNGGNYTTGFSDEQYEWLKQDLKYVPKDKLVILCVHIPLVNGNGKNVQNVIAQLAQYKEAHIMAGHTHYTRNEPTLSRGVYEHVHGAVCGAWWRSNTNGDGTPNGFGVYDIEGNTIKNWYYMGVNTGMNSRDYQIRLYRGNHKSGGQYEYFAQQHGDNVILANVFNADDKWTIKVYEDNVYSGTMSKIAYRKEEPAEGTGIDNPTKPSTKSSQDWWAIGYLIGVKNASRSSYMTSGFHLYKYTLKNKNAAVRVEATDRFGRTYVQSEITQDYDYSLMLVK